MATSRKTVISRYMAKLGSKGGRKTGPSKARDPEKMRQASKKRWDKARAEKQAEPPNSPPPDPSSKAQRASED